MRARSLAVDVSVVICTYTRKRSADLLRAVRSVRAQTSLPREVLVVVDHNPELAAWARTQWHPPGVRVVASLGRPGLAGSRNSGIAMATSDIVAFLDDDAEADPSWLSNLLAPYADHNVIACGGAVVPVFHGRPPSWWPAEFDWVVGCSYRGLPAATGPVRNLIGANMSARRAPLVEIGGFVEGLGRVGTHPAGCEETELCIRLGRRWPDARIVYEPSARVRHSVPADRLSWRYFRSRCFAEGVSKALVADRVGTQPALASEREYALHVLPRGVADGIAGACRGEPGAGRRALAIAAGLTVTTAGYLKGRLGHGAAA